MMTADRYRWQVRVHATVAATVAATVLLLNSCASTRMDTYRDPSSYSRSPMKGVAVFAIVDDLGSRQTVESLVADRFIELTGAHAVRAMDLLPPTRQIPSDEAAKILLDSGVDGVLFMILTDAYTDQASGTATTTGFATVYGNTVRYRERTTYTPGKPRATYDLRLADLRTGEIVWISSTVTRGNAYANDSVMAKSLARSTIKELLAEQLVLPQAEASDPPVAGTAEAEEGPDWWED